MTESQPEVVYKETVQIGDTEITIEYSDVIWDDFEWPPMSLTLSGANYHAQLDAVRKFLSWQDQANVNRQQELQRAEQIVKAASGEVREWLNDELIERWQDTIYEDATRSIGAAVMLTPLVESLFHRLALCLGAPWEGRRIPKQIMKLVRGCGLSPISRDLESTLRALFAHRNEMFHWGIEWPIEERERFDRLIRDSGWPRSWFDHAVDGDGPWIFYLTEEFVSHCLDSIERLVDSVRDYVQNKGYGFGWEQSDQFPDQGRITSLSPLRCILSERARM